MLVKIWLNYGARRVTSPLAPVLQFIPGYGTIIDVLCEITARTGYKYGYYEKTEI